MNEQNFINQEKLKSEFEDYKKFAFKGDMLKLAIAFILGGAFNKVVSAISENFMMPLLNFLINKTGSNWRTAIWTPLEGLNFEIGKLAAATIDFILMSLVLYIFWRLLRGQVGDEEMPRPFVDRLRDFVLGDWFFAFTTVAAVAAVIVSQSWMVGVWAFIMMSLMVSWFQNRELRKHRLGG